MSQSADTELELFRQGVNCAAVLERMVGGWKLDVRESTRRALKYRRGEGEIIIVNHDGRGWWDATGSAKGDVFNLVQHLDPTLNFRSVRKVLRAFVGIVPAFPPAERRRTSGSDDPERSPAQRWAARPPLRQGDPAWTYLTDIRALPPDVVETAARQDCVRLGAFGSAWFAHRWNGAVTQGRGPEQDVQRLASRRTEDAVPVRRRRPSLSGGRAGSADRCAQPGCDRAHARRYPLRRDRRRDGTGHPGGAPHDLGRLATRRQRAGERDRREPGGRPLRRAACGARRRNGGEVRAAASAPGAGLERCPCCKEASMRPERAWVRLESGRARRVAHGRFRHKGASPALPARSGRVALVPLAGVRPCHGQLE